METITHSGVEKCRNCGNVLTGPYCAVCGQRESDGNPPTLKHFFHDLIHEFLHIDGKIFHTLCALFFQPGKLTEEYWAGHLASWIRPIRIFLTVVALQVLISAGGQGPLNHHVTVRRSLEGTLRADIYKPSVANTVEDFIDEEDEATPGTEDRREFEYYFGKAYATIRYTSVLVFTAAAWLFYYRQQPYFVNNLIVGLHFYSFWYAIGMLASIPARWNPAWNDLSVLASIYLFVALRRLYHERWYVQLAKAIGLYLVAHLTELGLGYAAAKWVEGHYPVH
jgi:Protein of unknown function (DUF3667)